MNQAVVIHETDNVATSVTALEKDSLVTLNGDTGISVKVIQDIPFGHKFALQNITLGDHIIKYGEVIGRATQNIEKGEHVHVHNVESLRGRGDLK